jgi:diguanylate cyclase (GGDEF)-like protein/PAS domain S-box-containing protein
VPQSDLNEISTQLLILKQISNSVGAYLYSKDLQGNYTFVNENVLQLFKSRLNKVIGMGDDQFFDQETCINIKKIDEQVIGTAQKIITEESNYIKEIDEMRIFQSIKSPIFDEQGKVIGLCGISTDITEHKKLKNTLDEQQQLLNIVLDNIEAYVYMKSEDRRFLYVNSKVSDIFGLPVSDIIGKLETDILPAETAAHFHQSDRQVFKTNSVLRTEESSLDEEGNEHRYLSVKVPIIRNNKRALIGFSSDVTEIYNMKEQFKRLANTDYLTNLYNRRYFMEQGEREFSRAKRHKKPFSIISVDIDHFKSVNDNFGHPAGDHVLKVVSKNLQECIRKEDILARIGGEEFTIILPETPLTNALSLAERTRENIQKQFISYQNSVEINVTVSLGVTLIRPEDINFDAVLVRVDEALYNAKTNGRNRVFHL